MTFTSNLFRIIFSFSFILISFSLIAEPTLEEVVVSARKVDESVQDVPIAMSVFTSSDIDDAGDADDDGGDDDEGPPHALRLI